MNAWFHAVKEVLAMFARNVTLHLKADKANEFTRTLESDVLPMLRKQPGFKDEITFLASDRDEAVAISLWDKKESAEAYTRETYPAVLQKLQQVVVGTPQVESYEVANSTFHKIGTQGQSFNQPAAR
jgi:heme-degrading monooxygenase HmoA